MMPLSLEQEQKMEAILSSVTCLLLMLMVEVVQLEGKCYKPRTNNLNLTNFFNP